MTQRHGIASSRMEKLPAFLFPTFRDAFEGLSQETYSHFLHLAYCVLPEIESYEQLVGLWEMVITADIEDDRRLAVALIPAVYLHSIGNPTTLQQTIEQIRALCAQRNQPLSEWLQFAVQLNYGFESFPSH